MDMKTVTHANISTNPRDITGKAAAAEEEDLCHRLFKSFFGFTYRLSLKQMIFPLLSKMAPTYGDTGIVVLFVVCLTLFLNLRETVAVLQYDRDTLLRAGEQLGESNVLRTHFNSLFFELESTGRSTHGSIHRVRKRGRRGGALSRLRQRSFRPPLPSLFLGNARSLPNKVDELTCNIQTRRDYRECSVFCFTETWLALTSLTAPSNHRALLCTELIALLSQASRGVAVCVSL